MRRAPAWRAVVLAAVALSPALAHRTGEGYIFLLNDRDGLRGRIELPLRDLVRVLPLDSDGDGAVSPAELDDKYEQVEAYARERTALGANGRNFPLRFVSYDIQDHAAGRFARLHFEADIGAPAPDVIEAEYRALFDAIPNHRGFLVVERNARTGVEDNESIPSILFTPDEPRQSTDLTEPLTSEGFFDFFRHGVWHIWIGIDHVLFVLTLVMISVLRREGTGWAPATGFLPAFLNIAKIVTLFTVAHSITLSLAALGVVQLPSRLVESIIALSVALAAINNIRPIFGRYLWSLVFLFGLFHGFGFASVLGDLTQSREAIVKLLLGFNLGVEAGQLAVILLAFPPLYLLRNRGAYRRVLLPVASAVIALVAAQWFFERALGLA